MGPFTWFRPQHFGKTRCAVFAGRGLLFLLVSMAPHLTKLELDFIFEEEAKGVSMKEIHRMVQRRRAKQGHDAPCLRRFSEAFRGRTYRRSQKETRGRKRTFTREWVQKLDRTRKKLQRAAQGEREVRWEDVRRASRAPKAHRSTLMHRFEGLFFWFGPMALSQAGLLKGVSIYEAMSSARH
jgi:DNA-binding transcriptional MerR regulator